MIKVFKCMIRFHVHGRDVERDTIGELGIKATVCFVKDSHPFFY